MEDLAAAFAAAPHGAGGWENALGRLALATGSSGGQRLDLGGAVTLSFGPRGEVPGSFPALTLGDRPKATGGGSAMPQARPSRKPGESSVALLRTRKDGPVRPDQRAAFERAGAAILQALRAQNRLEDQAARHMIQTFEAIGLAALVFDASGKLRAVSERGKQQLGGGQSLRVIAGRLRCGQPDDQRRLDEALAAAAGARAAHEFDGALTLALGGADSPGGGSNVLTVIRREADEASISHLPHVIVLLRGRAPNAPPVQVVRRALGLTGGEAAVALQIADGKGRETIAAERGVAPATVHAQLRSIFAKVGVSRELALAIKIHRLMEI